MLKLHFPIMTIFVLRCYCDYHNVCKSMDDYITIDNNENCWYNPDVGASAEDIITRRGYPFESYEIVTEDDYINVLYRIPHNSDKKPGQPILLHGGMGGGPLTFLYIGNRSLAFFLVNNGFDVWLSNRRGSINETGHRHYNKSDKEFWNFSFHETGMYDIEAEVDFIAKKAESSDKIIFVGYSMGTTESYVYSTLKSQHAEQHLAGIISLSPIAFMGRSGGTIAKLAPFAGMIETFLRRSNTHYFLRKSEIERMTISYESLIKAKTLLTYVVGEDSLQVDDADLPVYFNSEPTPTSIKTLVHFAQEVNAGGSFQYYDYGPIKNLMVYKSLEPPSYNLSAINVPVHLFYGEGDIMSAKQDVLKLYEKLTVENKSLTSISQDNEIKFNHADFMLAKDIEDLLHKVLLKIIKENMRA